jgi:hypothetical protein
VTSRFVLDKLDLNFAPSRLLLRFGLVLVLVFVSSALGGIMIIDERVLGNRGCLTGVGLGVCWSYVSWVHVESALAFAHIKWDASGRLSAETRKLTISRGVGMLLEKLLVLAIRGRKPIRGNGPTVDQQAFKEPREKTSTRGVYGSLTDRTTRWKCRGTVELAERDSDRGSWRRASVKGIR